MPPQPGFGVPDDVELPDERVMLAGYVLLAATVTAAAAALPPYDWQWNDPGALALSVLKAVATLLAVGSWPAIIVYPYEVRSYGGLGYRLEWCTVVYGTGRLPSLEGGAGLQVGVGLGDDRGERASCGMAGWRVGPGWAWSSAQRYRPPALPYSMRPRPAESRRWQNGLERPRTALLSLYDRP